MNAYERLLARAERDWHAVGRNVLIREGKAVRPGMVPPLLEALRAGRPVVVPRWMVENVGRHRRPSGEPARFGEVRVEPDGTVEVVGR